MKTTIVPINNSKALEYAKLLLDQEQVIAAPTDTVFGVMCRYDSVTALTRLYEAKDRPPQKAIPILLGCVSQLTHLVRPPLEPRAELLMEKFWPGPLTIILPAHHTLPETLTAGQPTVAVRIPEHEQLRRLLSDFGPLAVTSANLSGKSETNSTGEVYAQLSGRIPLILADDQLDDKQSIAPRGPIGVASTIIDLSSLSATNTATSSTQNEGYKFLRAGPIQAEVQQMLEQIAQTNEQNSASDESSRPERSKPC